jgi:hypothetical protein
MARPTYDITLCHADARRADAETLHDALVPHAKVWSAARSLRPGEPVTEAARAVESAGLVVVLVGGGDALDHTLGDALARAITATRADARRVVVPVYLDARGESHPLYGTAVLTGLALHRDGRDKVVEALRARASGLRALWSARPRVALVGVVPEMENCLAAVATRLRPMAHEIEHFDACDPASAERARKADLRVMLVGARTGGTTVLRDLVDGGNFAMKLFAIDTDDTPDDELLPAKKLRARIEGSFDSVDEAAGRAQDHFARWLAAWVVTPPGTTTALEPWERSYLDAQRTRWTVGTHETLRDAKSGKPIPRASLYISLRGRQSHFAWEDASGTLFVDPRPKHLRHEPSPELADDDREGRMELVGRAQGRNNPWLEAVLSHRELPFIVVEGEAGAGKTVLLQHLACVLTAVHLGTAPVLHRLDLGAFGDGAPLLRVPLLVEARRLAPHLREGNVGELLAALLHEVLGHAPGALTAEALRDGMRAGRYVLLVDSLDEVPGLDARERIVRALDNLAGQGWPLRVVLTTRPTAHTGITLGDRLALLQVAPMDDDRVRELIDRWASVLGEDDRYRASAFDAVRGVRERQGVDPERGDSITANPLLLHLRAAGVRPAADPA